MNAIKKRRQPQRFIRVILWPESETAGLLRIQMGKLETVYWFKPIPNELSNGAAFELRKFRSDEVYYVRVDDNPKECSCDCKGHERHRHCKHIDGLLALSKQPSFQSLSDMAKHAPEVFDQHEAECA